ncbi:MAG: alpha/beta fold hydrolase [Phycisphaeraceae bacterium]|nr:alpha/beta fold hydrolase [Phycisphaeraceae bacterium]
MPGTEPPTSNVRAALREAVRRASLAHPDLDEFHLTIEEAGAGEPVVFLHGLLGLNEHWIPAVETLSKRSRCIMLEFPLARIPHKLCSIDAVTAMVKRELIGLLDGPAVFIGNSLGGHLALRVALDHPEAVRGIVLAGSSGLFEREIVVGRTAQHRPSRDWLQMKINELFSDPANVPAGTVDRVYEELSNRRAARALVRLSKSAKSDNLAAHLAEIEAPALLLWGRGDTVTPPSVAEEFNELMPNAHIHWLEGAGHAPQIEQAEAFTKAIDDFLNEFDPYYPLRSRQEVA